MNAIEVSTGYSWQPVSGPATISVSSEFTQIMEWARTEMQRTNRIKQMAAESVTVADALAAYELAAEKLQVIITLVEQDTK